MHTEYTMEVLSGLGKEDRKRLSAIVRGTKGTLSVKEVSNILKVSPTEAAKMLSRWAKKAGFHVYAGDYT